LPRIPQLVQTLKSLSSVALLAVSQLCTTRSNVAGISSCAQCRNQAALTRPPPGGAGGLLVLAGDPRDEVRGGLFADRLADLLGLTRAPGAGPRRAPL